MIADWYLMVLAEIIECTTQVELENLKVLENLACASEVTETKGDLGSVRGSTIVSINPLAIGAAEENKVCVVVKEQLKREPLSAYISKFKSFKLNGPSSAVVFRFIVVEAAVVDSATGLLAYCKSVR
jgi:hypothetical protein